MREIEALSMVAGVFWGDLVSRGHTELSIDSQQLEIVSYRQGTLVELDVMVGAETEDIARHVRTIVWLAKRTHMSSFSIRTCRYGHCKITDLTAILVEHLHPSPY